MRLNAVLQLAEEEEKYNIETINHKHDKLMKNILKDKKEAVMLINNFLEPKEKIKEKELTRYTNSYISKKYKSKEADLVYRVKSKEIFFLIEHQSYIDNRMPFRILNYCVDIMQEWNRNKKVTKSTQYPVIVPIVVYTGSIKWKVPTNFKEKQIGDYIFKRHYIDLEYNLIDVNKLTSDFLIKKDTKFCYTMLLEKSKNKKELIQNINEIIRNTKNKQCLEELTSIILYILNETLNEDEQQELLNKIDNKVGDDKMSTLIDRLIAERKRDVNQGMMQGLKQGLKQGLRQVVENMLNLNMEDEIIIKTTGIGREELGKIKNKMKREGVKNAKNNK